MSESRSGAPGSRGRDAWRRVVMAFAVVASSVCLGGAAAILAISQGASTVLSLSLMATLILCGGLAAVVMTRRQARRGEEAPREQSLLERQLSARYGLRVERVAWHVWRIDGELVEATLDPRSGYLTAGGRELQL